MKKVAQGLVLFTLLALVSGVLYPLILTVFGQMLFSHQANGSLVYKKGELVGSSLMAQKFDKEIYFWPRPSANDYKLPSGGSNLGPISAKLKKQIEQRKLFFSSGPVPSELLYASGSGLDPHISLETARFQISRVAAARGIDPKLLEDQMTKPIINVLELNLWLDTRGKE